MINNLVLIDGTRIKRKNESQKFYEKVLKYMPLADAKLAGATLEDLAKKEGVSREAIRLRLKYYFPDIKFPRVGAPFVPNIPRKCNQCGKEYIRAHN